MTEWSHVPAVARPLPEPEPQPVLAPLTTAAIFMVLTIEPGGEDAVRDLLADWAGLQRSVGFRVPEAPLGCVAGIGSDAWDRLFSGPRPAELHPFRELTGTVHRAVSTPGDLLFHVRHERMDVCFEFVSQVMTRLAGAATVVDEVHGFRYFDERDLLGFVDGTENPVGRAAGVAALTGDADPGFAGGSYVIVQKYLHDMEAWNALAVEEQEKVIGRTKLSDIEMPDDIKPANSHVALNTIEEPDGTERQILRANMPFGEVGRGEFGTYYIAYAATPSVTEQMLVNMFIGNPPGNYDRILDFSTAVTGSLFFAPSADFLDDLPDPPGALPDPPGRAPAGAAAPDEPGSLGIGSLKRSTCMNNLHRELAPISDAAWADIEQEARRTFEQHVAARRVVGRQGTRRAAAGQREHRPPDRDRRARGRRDRPPARGSQPLVRLRVPFTVSRADVDAVERGAQDADWQPVKDAAKKIAFAEDRAVFEGYPAAGITGIRQSTSNPALTLPGEVRDYPNAVSQAVSALRLAGVSGPFSLLLSADAYTMVSETSDHGYPIREHLARVIDGEIIWAPAIDGAFLLSARGGDFELRLGQDLSIGYLAHDADTVQLYFQESLTFLVYTAEASVALTSGGAA